MGHTAGGRIALFVAAVSAISGSALPCASSPLAIDKDVILAEHNRYRAEVVVPPLVWSDRLAEGAKRWADTIAGYDHMQHSGTLGVGENLAYSSGIHSSLVNLIGMWAQEKQLFTFGAFPNVSRDGRWSSVGHYTQMVWRSTREVGCGLANSGRTDYLVCWYSPQGNFVGRVPY